MKRSFPPIYNRFNIPLGDRTAAGGSVVLTYSQKLRSIETASLMVHYPLADESGTTAENEEGTAARDGTYYNSSGDPPTLGVEGIGDGRNAILFNSDGGVMTYYTDNLRDNLSNSTFTLACWNAVNAAGIWTDGIARRLLKHGTGNDNRLIWGRTTTNNQLQVEYYADGTQYTITHSNFSPTDWFHWAIVVDKPNAGSDGALRLYIDGVQIGNDVTLTTNYSGQLENVSAVIGADNVFGAFNWHGTAQHFAIWNTALSTADILSLATV